METWTWADVQWPGASQPAHSRPARRRGPAWSGSGDQQLRTMLRQGQTHREISAAIGRTPAACKMRAHLLGAQSKRAGKRTEWSADDDRRLKWLIATGNSYSEAAKAMGRTKNSCIGRAFRAGMGEGVS